MRDREETIRANEERSKRLAECIAADRHALDSTATPTPPYNPQPSHPNPPPPPSPGQKSHFRLTWPTLLSSCQATIQALNTTLQDARDDVQITGTLEIFVGYLNELAAKRDKYVEKALDERALVKEGAAAQVKMQGLAVEVRK